MGLFLSLTILHFDESALVEVSMIVARAASCRVGRSRRLISVVGSTARTEARPTVSRLHQKLVRSRRVKLHGASRAARTPRRSVISQTVLHR